MRFRLLLFTHQCKVTPYRCSCGAKHTRRRQMARLPWAPHGRGVLALSSLLALDQKRGSSGDFLQSSGFLFAPNRWAQVTLPPKGVARTWTPVGVGGADTGTQTREAEWTPTLWPRRLTLGCDANRKAYTGRVYQKAGSWLLTAANQELSRHPSSIGQRGRRQNAAQ